jgi:NAD(P)-dependent dehydrogenase (short-subunit alcohol dehydrogenase family)
MGKLAGKTALITGGESGIGLATAKLFVAEGAWVHIVGIDQPKLDAALRDIGEDHVLTTRADVTDEAAVRHAVEEGVARFGGYDIILSNAGVSGAVAPIEDYPTDAFTQTFAVSVLGSFLILKYAGKHVPDGGSIIITSSLVGLIGGFGGTSGYVTAKHAQVGLMRSAAKEFSARRIRVNSLHPGPTSTEFQDSLEMRVTGLSQEEASRTFDGLIPLGRHTTPEEIAKAALYLASDDSAMVSSSTFRIDGGFG